MNNKKEYYIGEVILSDHNRLIELALNNNDSSLRFAAAIKSALYEYDLLEINKGDLNDLICIAFGCYDSIEFLDEYGTRRAYDYWLETWHEDPLEFYNIICNLLEVYKKDKKVIGDMKDKSCFVILDAILEKDIEKVTDILDRNEEIQHTSFIIDDEEEDGIIN